MMLSANVPCFYSCYALGDVALLLLLPLYLAGLWALWPCCFLGFIPIHHSSQFEGWQRPIRLTHPFPSEIQSMPSKLGLVTSWNRSQRLLFPDPDLIGTHQSTLVSARASWVMEQPCFRLVAAEFFQNKITASVGGIIFPLMVLDAPQGIFAKGHLCAQQS